MKQKSKFQKVVSIILLFAMTITVFTGCGSRQANGEGTENTTGVQSQEESKSGETSNEDIAMGRYVEETIDLSDKISGYNNRIFKLADGQLIITDKYSDFIVSKDNGVTWDIYEQDWLREILDDGIYMFDMKMGSDGTVYVVYEIDKEELSEEDVVSEDDSVPEDSAASEDDPFEIHARLMIVKPDGTEKFVETPVEGKHINNVWVSDSGRIFITIYGEPIYEVMEDGSCEKFLDMAGRSNPNLIQFQDNLMIIDGYDYDLIYDMENKTYVEDEILAEFINENYKERDTNGGSWFDLYFFPGEDGIIYLAGEKGLHRHVIGGSALEQVIDGNLSIFNNPAASLMGVVSLENNEFLALFSEGKLVRFTYDPNVPTVPNERLQVYSLEDNNLIRQAITLYQAENPEVFVEYETGMEENSSITREDALKNLNTKIMAGNGPDLLILDNMPADTYMEKGLLMDLSTVLGSLEGEDALFENIVEAFHQDGKIYMVPCEIQLPAVYGREKYTSQMKDLESMADTVEAMRKDYPGKNLLAICSEKGIMRMLSMASAPAWVTESGELDQENISEFLMQSKRIYDAQMDGLPDSDIERWNTVSDYYIQDYGMEMEAYTYFRWGMNELRYIGGGSQMELGSLTYDYGYASMTSISKIKNFEDGTLIPMPGQSEKVFYPNTMAGISAASENTVQAEEFLRFLLGKENQSSTFNGFAVNKAAFEESFIIDESQLSDDGVYGSISSSDEEGNYVEMNIYWPNEEQITVFRNWMESVSTPYIENDTLEDAVYEEGIKYMQGDESLKEAVAAIEEKVALYMAE